MNIKGAKFWTTILIFFLVFAAVIYTKQQPTLEKIPLAFTDAEIPVVVGSLTKRRYYFGIDTGSQFALSMPGWILKAEEKKPLNTLISFDAFGNRYKSQGYQIPKLQIGKNTFNNLVICGESNKYGETTKLWKNRKYKSSRPKYSGTIGTPLLEPKNPYFNFPKKYMAFIEEKSDLEKLDIDLTFFLPIPFEKTAYGIIIEIETDLGKRKFSVDTGSTENYFRKSLIFGRKLRQDPIRKTLFFTPTERFKIGNIDYGPEELCSLEIAKEFPIDGMLGMAFLMKHEVFIDYTNGVLYLR